MTAPLAQPYPERIAKLERENEQLRAERDRYREDGKLLWQHGRDKTELYRLLESTRQQYMDADQCWRKLDKECKRLRSEASELMAKEADQTLLIADLRQRLDWHTQNAEKQADVIREQGAEIERLRSTDGDITPEAVDQLQQRADAFFTDEEIALFRQQKRDGIAAAKEAFARLAELDPLQADLPPTRAEEREQG